MNCDEVLKTLTIDEKIRLLTGVGAWHTYDCNGKVPAIMMTDGPHGIRKVEQEKQGDVNESKPATCFPTASAVASSWNPEMAHYLASSEAEEAKKEGISVVLGCGTNIKRSPLCGRNFEYFSEDPFLAGKMATAYIKGMQEKGVGTSLKHFAGNSQETRRMTSNSQIDERALREIYLAAFEMAVKEADPTTLMCCYNRVNGDFGSANRHLLTDILRDEWGYKGAVISDWGATIDVVKSLRNGLNLEMPDGSGYHTGVLKKAYGQGQISEEEIDLWAKKILERLSSLAERVEENKKSARPENNRQAAYEIECESAVLLKNEQVLPLSKENRLILIGDLAENMRFQGGGSSHINATHSPNAVKAFEEAGYSIAFSKGYSNNTETPDEKLISETLKTIREQYKKGENKVLFFIGLTDRTEGEGYDRSDINLPENQLDLLERVSALVDYKDLIAISFGGSPMDFSWDEKVSAVLQMYLGGQEVDRALVSLVSGQISPSGKLSETMPLVRTDVPGWRYYAPPHDDVEYRESIFVGYRYYETYKVPVKYPFGYGLSYTNFEYSDLKITDGPNKGEKLVSFKVTNVGTIAGKEVAEVYVCPEKQNVIRSSTELKGFAKVYLEPGECKELTIVLNDRSFSVYDTEKGGFSVLAGNYKIVVGASVKDIRLESNLYVEGNSYFRNDREELPDYFKEQPHGMDISEECFTGLYGRELSILKERKRGSFDETCSFSDVSKASLLGRLIRTIIRLVISAMNPGADKNDPTIKMMQMAVEEGALEGLISNSGGAISKKMVDILLLSANRKYAKTFLRLFTK